MIHYIKSIFKFVPPDKLLMGAVHMNQEMNREVNIRAGTIARTKWLKVYCQPLM